MRPSYLMIPSVVMLTLVACKPKDAAVENADSTKVAGKEFKIDIAHSQLDWQAFKPMGSHQGIIPIQEGNVIIDGDIITGGMVVLDIKNIQVTDLEGEDKQSLEAHLRGTKPGKEDDFFNTNKYPTATYTVTGSTKIDGDPEATHMINGQLTMRDITKPVNMKAKVDLSAGNAVKFTALPFSIDRTEWGIKFMSKKFFDGLKDDFVNDDIKIGFTIGALL